MLRSQALCLRHAARLRPMLAAAPARMYSAESSQDLYQVRGTWVSP